MGTLCYHNGTEHYFTLSCVGKSIEAEKETD